MNFCNNYAQGDLVSYNGKVHKVLKSHTSDASDVNPYAYQTKIIHDATSIMISCMAYQQITECCYDGRDRLRPGRTNCKNCGAPLTFGSLCEYCDTNNVW